MADGRRFVATVCVRHDTTTRIELAPAQEYGGPDGRWRVRVDRRWHNLPDGTPGYLAASDVGALVASALGGEASVVPAVPDLPRGTLVSAPAGPDGVGGERRELTRIVTVPYLLHDGDWHVGVHLYGRGTVLVRASDLKVRQARSAL